MVQRHAARRLHFDFRLEMDGVLKSWAVPRGPSLDPAERRLAVHVEDHPIEYGGFEGVIPAGQYGGGTVMLWDRGKWEPIGDPKQGYAEGKLKFRLHGERLRGAWTLVRMGGRAGREARDNWLLIKEQDEEARPGKGTALLSGADRSVLSGRIMEEIARDADRVWDSRTGEARAQRTQRQPASRTSAERMSIVRRRTKTIDPSTLPGARAARMPAQLTPQMATAVARPPSGADWIHEIKYDGYRVLARIENGQTQLLTRGNQNWTHRFGALAKTLAGLPVATALLDGEIVVAAANGTTSFGALQAALAEARHADFVYCAFDLPYLDGWDLHAVPLDRRKAVLRSLLDSHSQSDAIRFSDHIDAEGEEVLRHACRLALEGIVSKRRDAPYRPGRGRAWLKCKCLERQEFAIGGFTEPAGGSRGIGALLVGHHDGDELIYAGKVGTGFSDRSGMALRRRLEGLLRDRSPFKSVPPDARRGARWVKPALIGEVQFQNWTEDGRLRHPSFLGLREDRMGTKVARDPSPAVAATQARRHPRGDTQVAGVTLTHPDRVLFPDQSLTKRDIAEFYVEIAPWILPHVVDRPLSLVRCPDGQGGQCFFQKHVGKGGPGTIRRVQVEERSGASEYVAIDDVAGLVSLVQLSVLEIHPWGARTDDVERPDRLVIDLDPHESVPWGRVVAAARLVRDRLARGGLHSFAKTTGGKGLHVVVPLRRRHGWDDVKTFAKALAAAMAEDSPGEFTINMAKAARAGRIFIDYLRNDRGATAIAPYSTRARKGAPVATPVGWAELSSELRSAAFTVRNLPPRLRALGEDPWAEMGRIQQSITQKAWRALA